MIPFHIIVAMDNERGIGRNGRIPWHLKGDLRHFKEVTTATQEPGKKNIVIMGRKTWDSLPEEFRPLPGRVNVVITRAKNLQLPEGVFKAAGLEHALALCGHEKTKDVLGAVYVIGGGEIYQQALRHPQCRRIYATRVHGSFQCDTFFPDFERHFREKSVSPFLSEGAIFYHFAEYVREDTR